MHVGKSFVDHKKYLGMFGGYKGAKQPEVIKQHLSRSGLRG